MDSAQIGDVITLHYDNFSLAKTAFTFKTWGGMCKDQYGVYMSGFVGGDSIGVGESVRIVHPDDTEKVYVVSRIEKFMQSCMTAELGDDIKLYLENMSIGDFTFRDKLMKL